MAEEATSLWGALSRRKVLQATGFYLAGAWVVLQLGEIAADVWAAPDWLMRVLFVVLVAGIPVVAVLSWLFEFGRDGFHVDRGTGFREIMSRGGLGAWGSLLGLMVAVAVVVYFGVQFALEPRQELPGETPPRTAAAPRAIDESSIAVLPFANMTPEEESDYFADGISEEILHILAAVDGLKVAARTSSFFYKDRNLPMTQIGAELGVATLLEGSVRQIGNRVRVTAQLIDARDGFHHWSKTYDRDLDDIFAVQTEIAEAIANAMQLTVGSKAQAVSAQRNPTDIGAYSLYLAARQHIRERTAESLQTAERLLEQAVAQEPDYALAWAALAETYALLVSYGNLDEDTARELAWPAIERALEIAPDLPDAHAALGLYWSALDRDKAIAAFEHAIELGAQGGRVHLWLGNALYGRKEREAALAAYEEGIERDPDLIPLNAVLAARYQSSRRNEEALARYEHLMSLIPEDDPEYGIHRYASRLGALYWQLNDYPAAIRTFRRQLAVSPSDITAIRNMMGAQGMINDVDALRAWGSAVRRILSDNRYSRLFIFFSYADAFQHEEALEYFEANMGPGNGLEDRNVDAFWSAYFSGQYEKAVHYFFNGGAAYMMSEDVLAAEGPRQLTSLTQAWYAAEQVGAPEAATLERIVTDFMLERAEHPDGPWDGGFDWLSEWALVRPWFMLGEIDKGIEAMEAAEARAEYGSTGYRMELWQDPLFDLAADDPRLEAFRAREAERDREQRQRLATMSLAPVTLLVDRPTVEVPLERLLDYVGFYESGNTRWEVAPEGEGLTIDRLDNDRPPMRLIALSETEFYSRDNMGAHLEFARDELDRPTHFLMRSPFFARFSRVQPKEGLDLPIAQLTRLTGHYVSEDVDRQWYEHLRVHVDDAGQLFVERHQGRVQRLLAESENQFFIENAGGAYRFEGGESGPPERLVATFGGGLSYRRVSDLAPEPVSRDTVEHFLGRYRIGDLAVGEIALVDGRLFWATEGATIGAEPQRLILAGPDRLLFDLQDRTAELLVLRDAESRVTGLDLREGMMVRTYPRCGADITCLD